MKNFRTSTFCFRLMRMKVPFSVAPVGQWMAWSWALTLVVQLSTFCNCGGHCTSPRHEESVPACCSCLLRCCCLDERAEDVGWAWRVAPGPPAKAWTVRVFVSLCGGVSLVILVLFCLFFNQALTSEPSHHSIVCVVNFATNHNARGGSPVAAGARDAGPPWAAPPTASIPPPPPSPPRLLPPPPPTQQQPALPPRVD